MSAFEERIQQAHAEQSAAFAPRPPRSQTYLPLPPGPGVRRFEVVVDGERTGRVVEQPAPEQAAETFSHYAEPPSPAPAEPPPAPAPAPGKPVDREAARAAVSQMLGGERVGVDNKAAILDALRGRSPEEIAEMSKIFGERMVDESGQPMDMKMWVLSMTRSALSGRETSFDQTEALALLSGDPVQGAVAALDNAANGGKLGLGVDKNKVYRVLAGLSPEERMKVVQAYQEKTNVPLHQMLKTKLDGDDLTLGQALLEGDVAKAGAVKLKNTDDPKQLAAMLVGASDAERQEMIVEYAALHGKPPEEAVAFFKENAGKCGNGAEVDIVIALADGDTARASAASIQAALGNKGGADFDAIAGLLDSGQIDPSATPEEREAHLAAHRAKMKQIAEAWARQYGPRDPQTGEPILDDPETLLRRHLCAAAGKDELEAERMASMASHGEMDRAFMLRYAKEKGKEPDAAMLKQAFAGLDEAQAAKLAAEYEEMMGKKLEDGLSGDVLKEAQRLREVGDRPKSAAGKLRKIERLYADMLDSSRVAHKLSGHDDRMRRHKQQLDALLAKDGALTDEDERKLDDLEAYMTDDHAAFRGDKQTVAKVGASAARVATGLAFGAATGGVALPWWLAASGGAAATHLGGMLGQKMLLGSDYGKGQAMRDLRQLPAKTVAGVVSAGMGDKLGEVYPSVVADAAAGGTAKITENLIQAKVDGKSNREALRGSAEDVERGAIFNPVGGLVPGDNDSFGNASADAADEHTAPAEGEDELTLEEIRARQGR